jgi:TRAP-type transport system small permease protein
MLHKFVKSLHSVNTGLIIVSCVALVLLMLLSSADVIGRYVLNRTITGTIEISELIMVPLVFLGLGYCTLKNGHLRVDFLTARLSVKNQRILDRITSVVSLVIIALIGWQLGLWAINEFSSQTPTLSLLLGIKLAPFILVSAIGVLFLFLEMLIRVFNSDTFKS